METGLNSNICEIFPLVLKEKLYSFRSKLRSFYSILRSFCSILRSFCRILRSLCRILRSFCRILRSFCRILRSLCSILRSFCRILRSFWSILRSFCPILRSCRQKIHGYRSKPLLFVFKRYDRAANTYNRPPETKTLRTKKVFFRPQALFGGCFSGSLSVNFKLNQHPLV
jgi:hypothetical protein